MNDNLNNTFNTGLDLMNRTYSSYINTFMWMNQRSMEFGKAIFNQIEQTQKESRTYFEGWSNKLRQNSEFVQEMVQENIETYNSNLETVRNYSNKQMSSVVEQIEKVQTQTMAAVAPEKN